MNLLGKLRWLENVVVDATECRSDDEKLLVACGAAIATTWITKRGDLTHEGAHALLVELAVDQWTAHRLTPTVQRTVDLYVCGFEGVASGKSLSAEAKWAR